MDTIIAEKPRLLGTYSIPSAALYIVATTNQTTNLKLNTRHLYHWAREGLVGGYLTGIQNRRLFVNFRDLISLRAIAIMRASGLKGRGRGQAQVDDYAGNGGDFSKEREKCQMELSSVR